MIRGITFEIPNNSGQYLQHILSCVNMSQLNWYNAGGEAYIIKNGEFGASLFDENERFIDGKILQKRLSDNLYYLIFTDLKGFPRNVRAENVETYEEFVMSKCTFVILIVDCVNVTIYSKDMAQIQLIFEQANGAGYENIVVIQDESDARNRLSVW